MIPRTMVYRKFLPPAAPARGAGLWRPSGGGLLVAHAPAPYNAPCLGLALCSVYPGLLTAHTSRRDPIDHIRLIGQSLLCTWYLVIPLQSRDPFSAGTCTERSPALNRAPGTIANSAKTALLRAGQSLISAGTGTIEVVFDLWYSAHACGANRERNGSTLLL